MTEIGVYRETRTVRRRKPATVTAIVILWLTPIVTATLIGTVTARHTMGASAGVSSTIRAR